MEGGVPPRDEDQPSGIHITIMMRPTLSTEPVSYCKTCDTFRAAEASALGTGLRSVSFVNFDTYGLPSGSFIPQHMSEARPASVKNGLGHPCLSEAGSIHVADSDQFVFSCQFGADDVKVMFSCVGDLCMDCPNTPFVAGAGCLGELRLILSVMAHGRYRDSIAATGEGFQPEINANFTIAGGEIVKDFALHTNIPASSRVLDERTGFEDTANVSMSPDTIRPFDIDYGVTFKSNGARNKRHPTKSALRSKTCSKTRAAAMKVSRCGKLATDGLNGVTMQAESDSASGAKPDEVEGGWPANVRAALPTPFGLSLRCGTEIPDLIARDGMAGEMLARDGILDAEFECENAHFGSALAQSGPIKSASLDCRPVARSHFVPSLNANGKARVT